MVNELQQLRPDVELFGVGPDPIAITTRHGVPAAPIGDPIAVDAMVQGASTVVIGGGAPWDDVEFRAMGGLPGLLGFEALGSIPGPWLVGFVAVVKTALVTILRDVPMHLHAITIDRLEDPGAEQIVTFMARAAASVTAGDATTQARLAQLLPPDCETPVVSVGTGLDSLAATIPASGTPPRLALGRLRLRRDGDRDP
jgi:hypothetical protein